MLTLLHTADWQIGRLFARADDDDANALFEARLDSVRRLAQTAQARRVDAVLVAGDVFDAQTVSDKTIRRLFAALDGYDGPWLLLPGNHDAALTESVWQRARRLAVVGPRVTLCLEPRSLVIDDRFQLLPAPLTQRHTHHDLTAWFDEAPAVGELPRVGLAHGCVQGVLPDDIDSANPIAPDRAQRAGLDYLALGDWHGTRRLDARTWYAGTPETDRFRANDSGQCLHVTLAGRGALPVVEVLPIGRYRWRQHSHVLAVDSDLDQALASLSAVEATDVVHWRVEGLCRLGALARIDAAVDEARARARALIADTASLRLEPTDEDLAALQADGYVGEVLQQLRARQDDPDQGQVASDALRLLATMLAAPGAAPPAGPATDAQALGERVTAPPGSPR